MKGMNSISDFYSVKRKGYRKHLFGNVYSTLLAAYSWCSYE